MKIKSNIMLALIVAFVAIFIMLKYVRADGSKENVKAFGGYNPATGMKLGEPLPSMV